MAKLIPVPGSETPRPQYDRARFYPIQGRRLPSVTTALEIIAKPALGPWYAKEERRAFEAAMLEVAARHTTITNEQLLDAVLKAVDGVKAADREKARAATIGTAAHAGIEWETRKRLRDDPGPEPALPDAAMWSVEAWKDWAKAVDFRPVWVERTLYCLDCGYAGTGDWLGYVRDVLTLGDIKTGKAIYAEHYLQSIAYRHAWATQGGHGHRAEPMPAGLVLRLPKVTTDPAFEAMPVPDAVRLEDFLAALQLWRWSRRMAGQFAGS